MENKKKVLELTDVEFECIENILKFSRNELQAEINNANKILEIQKSGDDGSTSNINGLTFNIFNRDVRVIDNILYKMIECEVKKKTEKAELVE